MKKILAFCLHGIILTLIPGGFIFALNDDYASFSENQSFPVSETPVYNEEYGFSPVPETSAVHKEYQGIDWYLPSGVDAAAPPRQPQPPVRTIVPAANVNAVMNAVSVDPPAYRSSINVIPGIPDPYRNGVYRVQLGAFSNAGLAHQCFNRLKSAGFTPFYEQNGSLYRVVIAGTKAADMDGLIRRLEAAGFSDAWIREER